MNYYCIYRKVFLGKAFMLKPYRYNHGWPYAFTVTTMKIFIKENKLSKGFYRVKKIDSKYVCNYKQVH